MKASVIVAIATGKEKKKTNWKVLILFIHFVHSPVCLPFQIPMPASAALLTATCCQTKSDAPVQPKTDMRLEWDETVQILARTHQENTLQDFTL